MNNVSMKNYTSYKLPYKFQKLVIPKNIDELKKHMHGKYKIIGGGSNLIFTDDYKGTIIKLDNFNDLKINDNVIEVGTGYNLIKLALKVSSLGLSGLEFASSIPGTVGGAIYNNAGAYNKSMSDVIVSVKVLDNNKIKIIKKEDLNFKYRYSIFKENNWVILSATIKLKQSNKEEVKNTIENYRNKRRSSQPLNYPSAGSVFRNPKGDYAARLIEESGLKGKKVGGAMVSEKHANFIVNKGNASGEDIVNLITLVRDTVYKKYGIFLTLEQEIVR